MKKNSMKKNRMLRLASTLMILTLLTTSIIGGTFAKYTTTGSATDTARVAKWGVVINTSGSLYSDAYEIATAAADKGNLPTAWSETTDKDKITVAAIAKDGKSESNIVAPGTKNAGQGLSFSISGTPEVAVEVKATVEAEDIFLAAGTYGVLVPATTRITDADSLKKVMETEKVYYAGATTPISYTKCEDGHTYDSTSNTYYILTNEATATGGDYFPVTYTLLSGGTIDNSVDSADKIAQKLVEKINGTAITDTDSTNYKASYSEISRKYNANTDLATGLALSDVTVGWEWPFDVTDNATDVKDTILGNLIAARGTDSVAVIVGAGDAVTPLTFGTEDDYTVKNGKTVVANLQTKFDITLTVEQVD